MKRSVLRESRRLLAPLPGDPATPFTFGEALQKLENSQLRPGQTMIRRERVMEIVRHWDLLRARSSISESGTARVLVEGHHTTIAATMLDTFGPRMGAATGEVQMAGDVSWLPRRRGGRRPMTIVES